MLLVCVTSHESHGDHILLASLSLKIPCHGIGDTYLPVQFLGDAGMTNDNIAAVLHVYSDVLAAPR